MSEASIIFQSDSVTPEALAHLGEGHIAYVKQVRSEDRAGPQAVRAARRRRHADHADRQPRSRDRERLEQRAASRQRPLTRC
jgi:hypothetical protein